jgi:two-component system LytT family response regulator
MSLKCIAVDDEPLALELVKHYVSRIPGVEMIQAFEDAISASEFLRRHEADILFIDINMPDINGIDLVRSLEKRPAVIFTTAHKKFAVEGFELDAVDYLLKPISFDRFSRSVTKAIDYIHYKNKTTGERTDSLFVYSEYRLVKIPFPDILYIESLEDYIKIHLVSGKPVLTLMPLKKVLEKLPGEQFQRIHRSYIVAADKVQSIQNRKVMLSSGAELPVSDTYSQFIREWKKT